MGPFGEKNRLGTLEEDISLLRRRMAEIESAAKISKLEAAEVYDKTLRLMQRMAKRYEVDKKENDATVLLPEGDDTSPGNDPVSRSIMLRRTRGMPSQ